MVVGTNFTVSDVLDNDFETIMGIINPGSVENKSVEEPEVMSLGDFMSTL